MALVGALVAAALPAFTWAVAGGGVGADDADGIGVDPFGRSVISGGFEAFRNAPYDIFVTGYDRRGEVRWTRRFGGAGGDQAFDNDVDSGSNAVVTGSFNGTVDFGAATLTSRGATRPRYGDAFLLSVDARGGVRWVRQIGGSGSDGGDEVAVGPRDNVYVIGDSDGDVRLSPRVVVPGTGGRDSWAARYRPGGKLVWGRSLGGPGEQQSHGISTDGDADALVTGEFQGTAVFGRHRLTSADAGPDVFLAKLDRRGRVKWAKRFGRAGREIGRGVDADRRGNLYFTGEFDGTLKLGSTTLTSAGGNDSFLAKATARGRVLWAIGLGGPGAEGGPEIEVDERGYSYLAGSYSNTARFGGRSLTASGLRGAYVAKVSPRGRVVWVAGSSDSPFATLGELALGPGAVNVLGRFVRTVTLGSSRLDGSGGTDYFLARLSAAGQRR